MTQIEPLEIAALVVTAYLFDNACQFPLVKFKSVPYNSLSTGLGKIGVILFELSCQGDIFIVARKKDNLRYNRAGVVYIYHSTPGRQPHALCPQAEPL